MIQFHRFRRRPKHLSDDSYRGVRFFYVRFLNKLRLLNWGIEQNLGVDSNHHLSVTRVDIWSLIIKDMWMIWSYCNYKVIHGWSLQNHQTQIDRQTGISTWKNFQAAVKWFMLLPANAHLMIDLSTWNAGRTSPQWTSVLLSSKVNRDQFSRLRITRTFSYWWLLMVMVIDD